MKSGSSTAAAPRYTTTAGGAPVALPPVTGGSAATASLVLGVVGLFTSVVLVGGLLGVAGVVLGFLGLRTAGRTGAGRSMAVTGVVASVLAIVMSVLFALFVAWYANRTQSCYQPDSLHQYAQCVRHHLGRN